MDSKSDELKYRLLLVDDDDSFLTTTRLYLQKKYSDIEVVTISQSGEPGEKDFVSAGDNTLQYLEAVWNQKEQAIHCILIDHNMAGMTGLDLLRDIKSRDYYAPVVMLTGDENAMSGASVESFDDGARGYLFKTSQLFYLELNTTIRRVYREIIQEKWLKLLSQVAATNPDNCSSIKEYANRVAEIYISYFPNRIGFIRELIADGRLRLLASMNIDETLQKQLEEIDPDDYPFVKESLQYTEPTFKNYAYKWSKEHLGFAADLPIKLDRIFFIPLSYVGEKLGTISFYLDYRQGFFLKEEEDYASTLAMIMSAAIFQYQYRSKLRKQGANISELIRKFNTAKNEDEIYDSLVDHIHRELNQTELIYHITKGKTTIKEVVVGTDRLELKVLIGEQRERSQDFRVSKTGFGISGIVAATGKAYLVIDSEKENEWVPTHDEMKCSITTPLLNESQRVIAVLNSENSQVGHFDNDDLDYTESLGHIAATYISKLRTRLFLDQVLKAVSDKDAGTDELLRRVIEIIKGFTGYSYMIVATKLPEGIKMIRCEGFSSEEEVSAAEALRNPDPDNAPLIFQALRDSIEYEWNVSDDSEKPYPWYPNEEMKKKVKSQKIFLFKLTTGEAVGAFSLEFSVENALDEFQIKTILQILPIIARLLWDAEEHLALKRQMDILRVEKSFATALQQIGHNLRHLAFQFGSLASSIEDTESLSVNGKNKIEEILANADELVKLEHNVRALSGEVNIKNTKVTECLEKAIKILKEKIKFHGIFLEIKIPENTFIRCDPIVLQTTFMNLIDNSVEALRSQEREKRKVIARYQETNDIIRLVIEDNGPGFVGISSDRAFDWFESTTSGTGIGLPFSRERLRQCEGDLLSVRPKKLGGAALEIQLKKGKLKS